jgi:hypothetical protein
MKTLSSYQKAERSPRFTGHAQQRSGGAKAIVRAIKDEFIT